MCSTIIRSFFLIKKFLKLAGGRFGELSRLLGNTSWKAIGSWGPRSTPSASDPTDELSLGVCPLNLSARGAQLHTNGALVGRSPSSTRAGPHARKKLRLLRCRIGLSMCSMLHIRSLSSDRNWSQSNEMPIM